MNAINQYADVYQKWAEGQLKTGQAWVESMQTLEQFDPSQVWDKTIEAYQASVQNSLEAEVAGAKIWFEEMVPVKDQPEAVADLTKQMQEATLKAAEMQQSLADDWFGFLKQIDVESFSPVAAETKKKKPARKTAKKA